MNKVIVHIPHSSTDIPEEYKNLFVIDDETLNNELLLMTDRYTDEIFKHENSVVFPVSRLICDVERFRNEADEEMTAKGMWVCYEKTSGGKPLKNCTENHKNEILTRYYNVHHKKLTETVKLALEEHGECVIVDAHSFSSAPLPHEESQEAPRPDICIGTDDFHTPYQLLEFCKDFFESKGYYVKFNDPFGGTVVPMDYYGKNKQVESVMIEINRSLYMNEQTGEKTDNFETIKQEVSDLLIDLQNYRTICIIPAGTYIMCSDPAADLTPESALVMMENIETEKDLACLFAAVYNKAWWVEDELYDYEPETEEYLKVKEKTDFWFDMSDKLRKKIFDILRSENVKIPEKGYIAVLEPFMIRNGFIDGRGWWVSCSDDEDN